MLKVRVIPCLLLQKRGLVKTIRFDKSIYVGDAINAVRIFNEKEVDELIFLDITSSRNKAAPNFDLIGELATECFMPFSYGGGVNDLEQIRRILKLGVEKVVINKAAINDLRFIERAAREFGSSTLIVGIDVKKDFFGKMRVYDHVRGRTTKLDPTEYARAVEGAGAGEIFINSVDRDGTYQGYDLDTIKKVVDVSTIPVIACGGAASLNDFKEAVEIGGASAVSAGSFFVFRRPHNAVLISYPDQDDLEALFKK